jgi:predicted GIY-YIG superfamily endonuclease
MSVDDCKHKFADLSLNVLPGYFAELSRRMEKPLPLAQFAKDGVGVAKILSRLGLPSDFAGCYLIMDGTKPIYIGISRAVVARLRQHVKGKTHFDASLAYRMARKAEPHESTRSEAMANDQFNAAFRKAQADLARMNCTFLEVSNPLERYLFEVLCAMELGTSEWNTFETH